MTPAENLAADTLAEALVRWSSRRIDKGTALGYAKRYLEGEKNPGLAWKVFDRVMESAQYPALQ
jgi:hypothetical protein